MSFSLAHSFRLFWLVLPVACAGPGSRELPADSTSGATAAERARISEFWTIYRNATSERIAGRLGAAAEGYVHLLALNPDHEDALYYLGSMRLALGDFSGAEHAWRHLVEVNPSSARAHSQLGGLYLCLDDGAPFQPDSAETHFRLAHEINQEETGPTLHLGEAALLRDDLVTARRYFESVLGSHLKSAPAHFYVGYLAWTTADTTEARRAFALSLADAKSGTAVSAVPSEGDTRSGTNPMVAVRERCNHLEALWSGLGQGVPAGEMTTRYRRLDSLRIAARRKPR